MRRSSRRSLQASLITCVLVFFLGLVPTSVHGQRRDETGNKISSLATTIDWETRQGYELTHLNTWYDFRPSAQRAIAGYEAHERGIAEVVHLPDEPSVQDGDYTRVPVLVTLDEANAIVRNILNHRCPTLADGFYYQVPWDGNGYGCGRGWSGTSATHHTGIGLAYILAKYRHLMPDDLERDLNETVGRLDWFGDESLHAYMSYSNIAIAGACGMLVAGDYVEPDAARGLTEAFISELRTEGYAWFDRMYQEVKGFGYYEILSSYTNIQYVSLPAVYEMAKERSARQKARFLLDELYLHLAHLYQPGGSSQIAYEPGGNLAGFHDRLYDHTVTGRPNAHLMWLLTGDPGGELLVDWWPYSILVASGYEPPEYVTGIAMKEKRIDYEVEQTFWSDGNAATLAFDPPLPDLPQWSGTSPGRHLLIPHHTYMIRDGSLSLGGTIAHIYSSNAGSHNLRLSFAKTHPPLAITQNDPERASSDPEYPLANAFRYEQPSFRRLFHKNVVLSIWDPMEEGFDYTTAFIPLAAAEQVVHRGRWFFIHQGNAFAAYAILADPQAGVSSELKDRFGKGSSGYEGQFYYVSTPAGTLAAGVGEIASASDYGGFESFMADIEGRALDFDATSSRLSYATKDGETLAVQYSPEQYEIDRRTKQRQDFAPEYFIKSPWASHRIPTSDQDQFITEVNWNDTIWRYDWNSLQITLRHPLDKEAIAPVAPIQGDIITYTLSFSGTGQPITVTDVLPPGLSDPIETQATAGTINYDRSSRRLEWTGSASDGQSVFVTYSVSVTAEGAEPMSLWNTATLTNANGTVLTDTELVIVNARILFLSLILRSGL